MITIARKELTIEQRKKIISFHEKGLGYGKIASKTNFKEGTIGKIIQRWKRTGSVANKPRRGVTRKTTHRIDCCILNNIKGNCGISAPKIASEVKQQFSVLVLPQTIGNRLRDNGFKGLIARKKLFKSKSNMEKRLKWAKDHIGWSINNWKKSHLERLEQI